MSKITLLTETTDYLAFCLYWTRSLINDYVDIQPYDAKKTYSSKNTVCYVSYLNPDVEWTKRFSTQGFKIIVDHLWDGDVDTASQISHNCLTLRNPNWLWYYSCAEWIHLGHNKYQSRPDYKHVFFMPMNRQEWHRDQIIHSLESVLDQALYSYVAQGKLLDDDVSQTGIASWRSYFNPNWYNCTKFSVVAESYMRTNAWLANPQDSYLNYRTEVSEKIFKPMMGYHSFIVFGSVNTLKYLHREGFESFENLFDESYDSIEDDHARHRSVTNTVLQAVKDYGSNFDIDSITQQKLQHNHARLFDFELVKQRVRDEIVNEILEFAES